MNNTDIKLHCGQVGRGLKWPKNFGRPLCLTLESLPSQQIKDLTDQNLGSASIQKALTFNRIFA